MAKSMTVGKRENEKKRLAKREEKLKKKESKKLSGKANSFEDMIAYVDENGMITSTPPTEDIAYSGAYPFTFRQPIKHKNSL